MTPTLPRAVVLDLLPLYVAGEVSAETRVLVDEHLRQDSGLRRLADDARAELGLGAGGAGAGMGPSPELELQSLRRTRGLLRWQRLSFSWAVAFSCLSLASVVWIEGGTWHLRLLLFEFPQIFGPCVGLALSGWIHYVFFVRRRLRITNL